MGNRLSNPKDIWLVPTIPHTGSLFVVEHLIGYKNVGLAMMRQYYEGNGQEQTLIFDHIYRAQTADFVLLMRKFPAIVPLRHPKVVAKSWLLRGKDMSDYYDMWRFTLPMINEMAPYYLPLDVDDRQDWLDKIPIERETNWPEIHSNHHTSENRHDMIEFEDLEKECEGVWKLCAEIKPFLDRFY